MARALACALALLALAVGLAPPNRAADGPLPKRRAARTAQEALERFRAAGPVDRLKLVEKLAGDATAFVAVKRADLRVTVVARGTLEAARSRDVYCTVRAGTRGSTIATVIKSIIDDGTWVKKGQLIVELDSSGLQEQLKDRNKDLDKAYADRAAAVEAVKAQELGNKLEVRRAQLSLKVAQRDLKRFKGEDEEEKEILKERVALAELSLKKVEIQARSQMALALAGQRTRESIYQLELLRKREIEQEIARCMVLAPQDGLVVYHVPEQVRGGGGAQQSVVAQGEPVREGQKMLRICDLKHFQVTARVHEALIHRVRAGQPVDLRVDALPGKRLRGRVKAVATVPSSVDWFASDVKVFSVQISVTDPPAGLKPGMSCEARIEVERRERVLQVPVEAVLRSGRETFCYVKVGKELRQCPVVAGARGDLFVEITGGLKEGELVLRAPRAIAVAATRVSRAADGPRVLVRSVRPEAPPKGRRTWVSSFGLTHDDLERVRALPDVAGVVPVRSFPAEAHRLERRSDGLVVATVPGYAELPGVRLAAGRFLDEEDGQELMNVAVLGAAAAERLFPQGEAIGATVVLGRSLYRVVGILREQARSVGSLSADEVNGGVFIPLRTCRARFGERIIVRRGGSRSAEAVPITEALVWTRLPGQAGHVRDCIAALLEESHRQQDWAVRVVAPR
jgi:multidrug resistance efflux pump